MLGNLLVATVTSVGKNCIWVIIIHLNHIAMVTIVNRTVFGGH